MSVGQKKLEQLKNLGPASARMLRDAGINGEASLREFGATEAYLAVCEAGDRPSLNLLWALEGAIRDCHWLEITDARKAELRKQVELLQSGE